MNLRTKFLFLSRDSLMLSFMLPLSITSLTIRVNNLRREYSGKRKIQL